MQYRVKAFDESGFVLVLKRASDRDRADVQFQQVMDAVEEQMKSEDFPYGLVFVSEDALSEGEWDIISRDMITK